MFIIYNIFKIMLLFTIFLESYYFVLFYLIIEQIEYLVVAEQTANHVNLDET